MSRFSKSHGIRLAAFIVAFGAAYSGARDEGYLPHIGPAPLRIAMVRPAKVHTIEVVTSNEVVAQPAPAPVATNTVETPANVVVAAGSEAQPATNTVPIEQAEFVPAENLLTVTPKMLNEFFRPAVGVTNQAAAPMDYSSDMNFMPPSPNAMPSSRATYKSE